MIAFITIRSLYLWPKFFLNSKLSISLSVPSRYKFRAIPSIDILNKRVVRLHQGDFSKRQYYTDTPLEVAKRIKNAGHNFLHVVDLDGAKAQKVENQDIIKAIVEETGLLVDFGGGLRSTKDLELIFAAGAKQITIGTIAVTDPVLATSWLDKYGPEAIILGADVKEEFVAINGWVETSPYRWIDFIGQWHMRGIKWLISTDISKDGALSGPSYDLYKQMIDAFPDMGVIASGGVSNYAEVNKLAQCGLSGVVIGKAIHEGMVSLEGLAHYNQLKSKA